MRIFIDSSQSLFFRKNGWLELEALFNEEEARTLVSQITTILSTPGGNSFEKGLFFSRSHPELVRMLRKKNIGEMVTQLTGKKTFRLSYDHVFYGSEQEKFELFDHVLKNPGTICSLLIHLNGDPAKTYFFSSTSLSPYWIIKEGIYLLLVFSTHILDDTLFPLVSK